MNIIVITKQGKIVVRPDTTWEKDNEDLYLPDGINTLSCTPVVCSRICKPGRSVGERFASRYCEGFGFGVLLYPEDWIDGSPEGFAEACCLDHSSFMAHPMPELPEGEVSFSLRMNGAPLCEVSTGMRRTMEAAIVSLTKRIYIRTGDLVAVELQERKKVFDRSSGNAHFEGFSSEVKLVDFNIIVE